jgi:hypothetical protein
VAIAGVVVDVECVEIERNVRRNMRTVDDRPDPALARA